MKIPCLVKQYTHLSLQVHQVMPHLDELLDGVIVDLLLAGRRVVHIVVGEGLVGADPGLGLARGLEGADLAGVDDFPRQLGPYPHSHPHAAAPVIVHCGPPDI